MTESPGSSSTAPSGPEGAPGGGPGGTVDGDDALAAARDVVEGVVESAFDADDLAAMASLDNPRRILFVHAHPDDETIATGATIARCTSDGDQVTLVTCTAGEDGEVIPDDLKALQGNGPALADHRREELAAACEALGVTDHRFLADGRWQDSGMAGTAANLAPDAFANADPDEAAMALVDILLRVRPQVIVTYDPDGGYGHPDHIQAHRVTMRAVVLAAQAPDPWVVAKTYWIAVPYSRAVAERRAVMDAAGQHPFASGPMDARFPSAVVPDEEVAAVVDGSGQGEAVHAALRAHATQIAVHGPWFALSNGVGRRVELVEHYVAASGERYAPLDDDGREIDLFNGVA